jgi:hypothetical protein
MAKCGDPRPKIAHAGRHGLQAIEKQIEERRRLEDQFLHVFRHASRAEELTDEQLGWLGAQLDGLVLGVETYLWNDKSDPTNPATCVAACKQELNRCFREDVPEEDNSFPCVSCAECRLAYIACLWACSKGGLFGGGYGGIAT